MIKADEEEVFIGNFKIPDELDKIRHEVGYVPSEVNFYGDMKVKEFLEFNRRFYKNVDTVYEKELIETLGIEMDKWIKSSCSTKVLPALRKTQKNGGSHSVFLSHPIRS